MQSVDLNGNLIDKHFSFFCMTIAYDEYCQILGLTATLHPEHNFPSVVSSFKCYHLLPSVPAVFILKQAGKEVAQIIQLKKRHSCFAKK